MVWLSTESQRYDCLKFDSNSLLYGTLSNFLCDLDPVRSGQGAHINTLQMVWSWQWCACHHCQSGRCIKVCNQIKSSFGSKIACISVDNVANFVATTVASKLQLDGDPALSFCDCAHCIDLLSKDLVQHQAFLLMFWLSARRCMTSSGIITLVTFVRNYCCRHYPQECCWVKCWWNMYESVSHSHWIYTYAGTLCCISVNQSQLYKVLQWMHLICEGKTW